VRGGTGEEGREGESGEVVCRESAGEGERERKKEGGRQRQ
jgi:hypothetical protein